MRFSFCPQCGEKLIEKEIGDEGMLPYCPVCQKPYWDSFTTCVICAVVNEYGEVALLRQGYVSKTSFVCVAGVLQAGETAEEAARREIREELGLTVTQLAYRQSYFYPDKSMLMLGFCARVKKEAFALSGEVDSARWVPLTQAPDLLRSGGIAWKLVSEIAGETMSMPPAEPMRIRPAVPGDFAQIMPLYDKARAFMTAGGNTKQWSDGYPWQWLLEEDMEKASLFVCEKAGRIEAVFMFFIGTEPTYQVIEDGAWPDSRPYGTIHRLVSSGRIPRTADFCIRWCAGQCAARSASLRGDTHEDNLPMQRVFERNGFVRCGRIYTESASMRIAYQKDCRL